jgi:transposase
MAYVEHGMWEILEVLRRAHRGEGRNSIARSTGRSRKTVRRYLTKAAELGWTPGETEPDETLAARVLAQVRPGSACASPGEVEERLLPHLDAVRTWIKPTPPERPLTLTKVHDLLARRGVEVSYSGLYRFAVRHCDAGQGRTTVRIADSTPGELAEVDFGRLGYVPCDLFGRLRVLHALVVTLAFSRHQYVHLTHSQKLPDLIEGLEDAWEFFGGVVARLVIDNLRAAIRKADRYDPILNRTFEDYGQFRGFVIDPAPVRQATGKPHVERQVPYLRESFFRGETFSSRDDAQGRAVAWCRDRAGMRIHGTTRKRPVEQFDLFERAALKPIEGSRYDPPQWAVVKAHPDHHIRFGKALYSVPTAYIGREVTVRADRRLVRLYVQGELIKTHALQEPGKRSTDYADYPKEKTAYAMRSADYMVRQATQRGEHVGGFMSRLLEGDFPWARLRQAHKLLRLVDKYGRGPVDSACWRALSFDLINVHRLEQIVLRGLDAVGPDARPPRPVGHLIQSPLRFLREEGSFTHHTVPVEE